MTVMKNMKACRIYLIYLILSHFTMLDGNKNIKGLLTILQIMMG